MLGNEREVITTKGTKITKGVEIGVLDGRGSRGWTEIDVAWHRAV